MKGSRKENRAPVFDEKDADAARNKGLALELKPGTLMSWFGTWRREAEKVAEKGKGRKAS